MLKLKLKNIYFAWHHFAATCGTKTLVVLLAGGTLLLSLPIKQALGHHMRHGSSQGMANYYNNVSAIQSHGRNDEDVCMRGRLTSYIRNDCYEFTDEMGNSIEVELNSDVNWELVAKDQLIDLFGEIDRNMFRVKIDAKAFTIVDESKVVNPAETKLSGSVVSVAVAAPMNIIVDNEAALSSDTPMPAKSQGLLSKPAAVSVVSNSATVNTNTLQVQSTNVINELK